MGIFESITHKEEIEKLLNEAQSKYDSATKEFEAQKKKTTKRLENLGKLKVKSWSENMDSFVTVFARCEEHQRKMFDRFIDTFEYNLETGKNYDQALYSICQFADEAGIALQQVGFDEFRKRCGPRRNLY